jgi:hypothetical protein
MTLISSMELMVAELLVVPRTFRVHISVQTRGSRRSNKPRSYFAHKTRRLNDIPFSHDKQQSKTDSNMKNSLKALSILVMVVMVLNTTVDTSVWKDHNRVLEKADSECMFCDTSVITDDRERFLDDTSEPRVPDRCKDIRAGLDYMGQIDQDLQAFSTNGINEATLDKALNEIHRGVMVRIRDNRIFVEFKNNKELDGYLDPKGLHRWRDQLQVFLKASCFAWLPDVDFVLFLPDKIPENFPPNLPLFHFQKRQNGPGILIPYASHVKDLGEFQRTIEREKSYEWDKKESKLFWRGATTGGGRYNETNWDSFPRSKLVIGCEDLKDTCDAAFIKIVQFDSKETKKLMNKRFPLKDPISMDDHNKYKYIAWLDGNGACSGRSEKLVSGNSLLFKGESEHIEFYYSGLKPEKHYVSIKADMSDLESQLAWARSHDDEARKIALQMHDFSDQLSPERIACYLQGLLERYASLLTYDLKPIAELRDARPVLPGSDYGATCRNPVYACEEYRFVRNETVDSRLALLGDKGMVPEQCMRFVPMAKSQY